MNKIKITRTLNALLALIICGVLASAYYEQFGRHERPCPLCLLQRAAMIGVAIGALLNLRFGIQPKFYAFSLVSTFLGASISLRQILLHICPGFPVFGYPVFGISLYTWAFVVFACSAIGIVILLFLYSPKDKIIYPMNLFEKFAFLVVVLLTVANMFSVFGECGFSTCKDLPWPQPNSITTTP